jgi:hypothetical protein
VTRVVEAVASGLDAQGSGDNEWEMTAAARKSSAASTADTLPAPISAHEIDGADQVARELGQKLVGLQKVLRLSDDEVRLIAGVSGHVIELELKLDIGIAEDGSATLSYRHELFNMTSKPVTRLTRELWFEYTTGDISIVPINNGDRRIAIQRVHDTPNLAKFACQISPAIQPGDSAVVSYICNGGQFLDHLYWRQSLPRYTRHLTMSLRHRGAGLLTSCTAIEEHPDGSENSASEELLWDYDGDDIAVTLTRDYLRPNQAMTLRWDIAREAT